MLTHTNHVITISTDTGIHIQMNKISKWQGHDGELSRVWIFVYGAELADQSQWRWTMDHECWKSWVFSWCLKVLSDSSGCVAKEVDCSRLRDRTPRSSAGQWRSELWAREEFQSTVWGIVWFNVPRHRTDETRIKSKSKLACAPSVCI